MTIRSTLPKLKYMFMYFESNYTFIYLALLVKVLLKQKKTSVTVFSMTQMMPLDQVVLHIYFIPLFKNWEGRIENSRPASATQEDSGSKQNKELKQDAVLCLGSCLRWWTACYTSWRTWAILQSQECVLKIPMPERQRWEDPWDLLASQSSHQWIFGF